MQHEVGTGGHWIELNLLYIEHAKHGCQVQVLLVLLLSSEEFSTCKTMVHLQHPGQHAGICCSDMRVRGMQEPHPLL